MSDQPSPSFWHERCLQIKAGLARERQNLEEFESGRFRMGRRSGDGPWLDVTEQWVDNQKRIISTFENLLNSLEK